MNTISKLALTLTALFTLTFVACNKEDYTTIEPEQFSNTEQLKKDVRFTEMVNENKTIVNRIKDVDKIESLTSKDDLNEFELQELAQALGFNSFAEYERYYLSQRDVLNQLEQEYSLSAFENTEITSAVENAYIVESPVSFRNDPCSCSRSFYNCAASVTAQAVFMNLGCMALDLTVVAGILCHSAVIAFQAAESNQCLIDEQICWQNCN